MPLKLLYVDAFSIGLNPTATLAPALIQAAGSDVTFFGPGISSKDELEAGLLSLEESKGPFDAIVFGPSIPILAEADWEFFYSVRYLKNYNALAPDEATIKSGLGKIREDLPKLTTPVKAIWLLNFDYYAATQEQIDTIERLGLVVLGPNEQFISRLENLPDFATEEIRFKRKADRLSDRLYDWVCANPERVVPLTHFVAASELCIKSIASRSCDVSVPAVEYVQRKRALKKLKDNSLKQHRKLVYHLFRAASALRLKPHSSYLGNQVYSAAFRGSLLDTKFVFTARGGFGIPIRKFFEIPAAGAVMLCVPPVGFEALGFEPGKTHIECSPEALSETIADLRRQPEFSQTIATAGRELIACAHTLNARAGQLAVALEHIKSGTYRGAHWDNGEFKFLEQL